MKRAQNLNDPLVGVERALTHAAVLFVDFLFSPEGQKILEVYDYGSPAKEYGFKRWYLEKGVTIQQLEKDSDRWERGLRELGRRQG